MTPIKVAGSRLPVGSSAMSGAEWFTTARAIETLPLSAGQFVGIAGRLVGLPRPLGSQAANP